jgi:hypothetical protein
MPHYDAVPLTCPVCGRTVNDCTCSPSWWARWRARAEASDAGREEPAEWDDCEGEE